MNDNLFYDKKPSGWKWAAAVLIALGLGGLLLGFGLGRSSSISISSIAEGLGAALPTSTAAAEADGDDLTSVPPEQSAEPEQPESAASELAPVIAPQEQETEEENEREKIYRLAKEAAAINCTGAKPVVKDPSRWNENGRAIMEELSSKYGYNINARKGFPYLIAVNSAASTVTVYTVDENGKYTVPYMAMVCSCGKDPANGDGTPNGINGTTNYYKWRELFGPCYGQYAVRIGSGHILFHSVPYYEKYKDDLEYIEFNKLGSPASLGCIRLMTVDVKWINDNCPKDTQVIVYEDAANPGPMGKPGTIYIDPENKTLRGWDPTDPDAKNPWDPIFRYGTTLCTEAAWADRQAAVGGAWNHTINPTVLRGKSHDYKTEGTRG